MGLKQSYKLTSSQTQVSVYVTRGMLIESTSATWLYGTSSEHSVYYQYNFHGAQNIFTTMIQTEAPYYQPTPEPPAPFSDQVGIIPGDPSYSCDGGDFDGCDEAWAVTLTKSQNIHIGGAGTYSWFSSYTRIASTYIRARKRSGMLRTTTTMSVSST